MKILLLLYHKKMTNQVICLIFLNFLLLTSPFQTKSIRNRVFSPLYKRVAAADTGQAHKKPLKTMLVDSLNHVIRASRVVATAGWKEGRNELLIETDQPNQKPFHRLFLAGCDLVTAKVCSLLMSFLLSLRASPGCKPVRSRFPKRVRDSLSTCKPTASNIFLT